MVWLESGRRVINSVRLSAFASLLSDNEMLACPTASQTFQPYGLDGKNYHFFALCVFLFMPRSFCKYSFENLFTYCTTWVNGHKNWVEEPFKKCSSTLFYNTVSDIPNIRWWHGISEILFWNAYQNHRHKFRHHK